MASLSALAGILIEIGDLLKTGWAKPTLSCNQRRVQHNPGKDDNINIAPRT